MPTGFELVPVLISRVSDEERQAVRGEFYPNISKRFIRFLGENHKKELIDLGVASGFIHSIKQGHMPRIKDSPIYDVNIDHIIECSTGGTFSRDKETDPHNSSMIHKSFIVNHFNNLVLIPQEIHKFKNYIKDAQINLYRNNLSNDNVWFLMLTPKKMPNTSGYICHPQKNNELYGIINPQNSPIINEYNVNKLIASARKSRKRNHHKSSNPNKYK